MISLPLTNDIIFLLHEKSHKTWPIVKERFLVSFDPPGNDPNENGSNENVSNENVSNENVSNENVSNENVYNENVSNENVSNENESNENWYMRIDTRIAARK